MSILTYNSPRAYYIADEFRKRGKTVILGGVHVSLCPEDAKQHADAIIIGEGEEIIEQLIRDIEAKQLKPVYSSTTINFKDVKSPSYKLLSKKYLPFRLIQTIRGCTNRCNFCSINRLYGTKIRYRNIDNVVKDVYSSPHRFLYITDDNFYQAKKHSSTIMSEIIGAQKKWVGYSSASVGNDDKWLALAKKSGCKGLFIGFETLDKKCLNEVNKRNNNLKYEEQIKRIKAHGIAIVGGFVFGFDNELKSSFDTTLAFLIKNRIDMFICAALTPFPGPEFLRKVESRITGVKEESGTPLNR